MKKKPRQQPIPRTNALPAGAQADAPLQRDPPLHPGMAYLDGVAADFLRTLPPSAVEATRREIAAAITAVHDRLVWLTHTLLDERAARAKAAPHQPPSGAETELAALFDPPPAPESP